MLNFTKQHSKLMFFRVIFFICSVFLLTDQFSDTRAFAAQATLAWSAPTTHTDGTPITNLGGHKIHIGTTPGSYSQKIDAGNSTSYTLSSLNDATPYYFAVTAYDTTGAESGFSNQVSYTTPTPPPAAALYTLSAAAGSGGSITPSGSVVVSQGTSQTFTISPSTGYKIAGVTVDGASVGAVSTYTFSNVAANHSISASFTANTSSYSISASAGTGGSISPAGTTTITSGGSKAFTITPNTGYKVADVKVDGVSVGAVGSYTFSNVTANHTIAATFSANATSYTITASAGTGGSISPVGAKTLNAGASQSYTVTPNAGYYVVSVSVNGTTVASNIPDGKGYTYAFNNVSATHTISATFAVRHFNIVATAGTGGSVTPADSWVIYQASQVVTITPSSGYKVADVKVDGVSVGAVGSYTFSNVTANHTIAATFSANATSYSITASAGTGGSISPAGAKTLNAGASQAYTVTPNAGYYVVSVSVNGTTVASNISQGGYSYTFSNVAANHTISATFAVRQYNIVASAGINGSVSPANTWVPYNTSQTVTITPSSGHKIANVLVDGISVGAVSSYTFRNISAPHTLQATFL